MRRALTAIFVLFAATAGVYAQEEAAADRIKALLGNWQLSNADGDKVCTIFLTRDAAAGGHKILFDAPCAEAFPLIKDVTAWTVAPAEGLLLLNAEGKSILDLDEVENGIFEGVRPDGRYVMRNLATAHAEAKPDQVFGEWDVSQGADTPLCILTLSNAPASDGFALELKPGCDRLVTDFNPTSWRMDKGELVISSAQGAWRFEAAGSTAWQRVPEEPAPLWLVRP
ncbi:MAG TPA: AprI/Inh family metalloprotease inhibitor [Xanthobacteraceae bacterium]|nr:AprI/Inh family metalloprotease inhibitor [Xanthobacteraceae bacterium]